MASLGTNVHRFALKSFYKNLKFFAVVLIGFLLQACIRRNEILPHKEGEAKSKVRQIGSALWDYQSRHRSLSMLVGNKSFGAMPCTEVIKILSLRSDQVILDQTNPDRLLFLEWKSDSTKDPWGHEYLMAWQRHDATSSPKNAVAQDYAILIWSCGANGVNEFGRNDDVSYFSEE